MPTRGWRFPSSEEDCDLYLAVKRRRPYTTTLKLTYLFALDGSDTCQSQSIPDPDLWVHIYHDARLVEARRPRVQLGLEHVRRDYPGLVQGT